MNKVHVIHKAMYDQKHEKILWFDAKAVKAYLRRFGNKHFQVTFKLPRKDRSLDQNARHWARMTFAANALGDRTPEELHYDLCATILIDRSVNPPRTRTTSGLSAEEFAKFEEETDRILAERGIVIPEPDEDFELEGL